MFYSKTSSPGLNAERVAAEAYAIAVGHAGQRRAALSLVDLKSRGTARDIQPLGGVDGNMEIKK